MLLWTAGLGIVLLAQAVSATAETPVASAGAKGPDTVRVTPKQAAQLSVQPISEHSFASLKEAIGQIAFNEDASTPVLAAFSGRVTRLIARVGDTVKRGDPLFEMDSPEVVQAQTDLIAALQAVEKAKSQMSHTRRALDRATGLYAARAAAQRDLEQAHTDSFAAESDYRTAVGSMAGARNRLRVLGRDEAEIARVERERVVNPLISITSPIEGTVIARKVGPGQYVRADNVDPLYTVADLATMWLKANVSENDIALVRVGQQLEVRLNALPGRVYRARIASIGAASDAVTHRVVVRSVIENSGGLLKPEMFARFRIATGTGQSAPGLPVDAVVRDGDLAIAWIEIEPNLFQRRKVRTGMEQDGLVQVLDGARLGEKVAARGAIFLDNEWHD